MILHDAESAQQHRNDDSNTTQERLFWNTHPRFWNTRPRNLQDCFEVFEYIPKCVDDLVALRRITEEVLMDAAEDGVVYIELRTGPKCLLRRHHDDDGRGEVGGLWRQRESMWKRLLRL